MIPTCHDQRCLDIGGDNLFANGFVRTAATASPSNAVKRAWWLVRKETAEGVRVGLRLLVSRFLILSLPRVPWALQGLAVSLCLSVHCRTVNSWSGSAGDAAVPSEPQVGRVSTGVGWSAPRAMCHLGTRSLVDGRLQQSLLRQHLFWLQVPVRWGSHFRSMHIGRGWMVEK